MRFQGKKADANWSAGGLNQELKADDVKRRRNEAETFIKEHPDTSNAAQK